MCIKDVIIHAKNVEPVRTWRLGNPFPAGTLLANALNASPSWPSSKIPTAIFRFCV
jgi:hypothetical protein